MADNAEASSGSDEHAEEEPSALVPVAAPSEKKPVRKKKKKALPPIRINLSNCKYEILRIVQRKLGWIEVGDDDDWEVYWTDTSVTIERIMKLTSTQKINHFNGMLEICRKRNMAKNLQRMIKIFPTEYNFFPRSFVLPFDMNELANDFKARGKKQYYILKPDAGCQGKGIRLLQGGNEEKLQKVVKEMEGQQLVAQHYMHKPHLINGFKYDLRLYALVLSVDPLRMFIFNEGLARICTEKYCPPKPSNIHISFMHLTNYAVNKRNDNFVANEDGQDESASKWSLEQLAGYIKENGHSWEKVWASIQELVVKSLISVQPILKNNYRSAVPPDNDGFSCFELLGYDVMLDSKLVPWLIEVNHSASFSIESPLDLAIKESLITETLQLVRVDPLLISKTKKAEKKATANRLMEAAMAAPFKRRVQSPQPPPWASAGPPGIGNSPATAANGKPPGPPSSAAADSARSEARHDGEGATGETKVGVVSSAPVSGGGAGPSYSSAAGAEEVDAKKEAADAKKEEIVKSRIKWESKHMGGFSRIYPVEDPELQAKYETYLSGAFDVYASSFTSRNKKQMEAMAEERKKKEEQESEAVIAQKAKARAIRDRLAQIAVERRAKKGQYAAMEGNRAGSPATPDPEAEYQGFVPAKLVYPSTWNPLNPFGPHPPQARGAGGPAGASYPTYYAGSGTTSAASASASASQAAAGNAASSPMLSGYVGDRNSGGSSRSRIPSTSGMAAGDRLESPPRAFHPPSASDGTVPECSSPTQHGHSPYPQNGSHQGGRASTLRMSQAELQRLSQAEVHSPEQLQDFQQRLQQYYQQTYEQQQQQQHRTQGMGAVGVGLGASASAGHNRNELTPLQVQAQNMSSATNPSAFSGANNTTKQQHKGALPPSSFRPQSAAGASASQGQGCTEHVPAPDPDRQGFALSHQQPGAPSNFQCGSSTAKYAATISMGDRVQTGSNAASHSSRPSSACAALRNVGIANKIAPSSHEPGSSPHAKALSASFGLHADFETSVGTVAEVGRVTDSPERGSGGFPSEGEHQREPSVFPSSAACSGRGAYVPGSNRPTSAQLKSFKAEVAEGEDPNDLSRAWVQNFYSRSQTQQAAWSKLKSSGPQRTRPMSAHPTSPRSTGNHSPAAGGRDVQGQYSSSSKLNPSNTHGSMKGGPPQDQFVLSAGAATSAAMAAIQAASMITTRSALSGFGIEGNSMSLNRQQASQPRPPNQANPSSQAIQGGRRPPAGARRPTSAPHGVRKMQEHNYTIHTSPLTIKSQPIRGRQPQVSAQLLLRQQPSPSHATFGTVAAAGQANASSAHRQQQSPSPVAAMHPVSAPDSGGVNATAFDRPKSAKARCPSPSGALQPTPTPTTAHGHSAPLNTIPMLIRPAASTERSNSTSALSGAVAAAGQANASSAHRQQQSPSHATSSAVAAAGQANASGALCAGDAASAPKPQELEKNLSRKRVLTVHGKNMVIVDA